MNILSFITPVNLEEEQEKFFASATYHPTFHYKWHLKKIQEFVAKTPKYEKLLAAVLKQDHMEITNIASELFCSQLDTDILYNAHTVLGNKPALRGIQTIEHVVKHLEDSISFFDLDYAIHVTEKTGYNARPQHKKKRILVSKHINLQFFSADGQVKHEMTHILRYVNTRFNNIPHDHYYLSTDEGLAAYMQDYYGENGESSLFQHAAEYAVTEIGLKGSLRDMYEYLRGLGFNKYLAWQRVARHKFGFVDTSQPGDIMKPSMYFYQEEKIKHLHHDQRLKLFIGKISHQDLHKHEAYKGLIPMEKLAEYYGFT